MKKIIFALVFVGILFENLARAESYARINCVGSSSSVQHIVLKSPEDITLSASGILAKGTPIRLERKLENKKDCRSYFLEGTTYSNGVGEEIFDVRHVERGWNTVKISIEGTALLNCGQGSTANLFDNKEAWLEDIYRKLTVRMERPRFVGQQSGVDTVDSVACVIR